MVGRKSVSAMVRIVAVAITALMTVQWVPDVLGGAEAATTTQPAATSLDHVLGELQQHYQATKSFSANFDETIVRVGAPPLERSGLIHYEKPGKLRWEFEGSQPEMVVSDGRTIYDYDPGLNQVVETPLTQASRNQAAAAFLLGVGNVKQDFKAEAVPGTANDALVHIALTPRRGGQLIEAGIDLTTYNIKTLSFRDGMGNLTKFSFSNIRLNEPLNPSEFTFKVPEGADIVSAGEQPHQ